MLLLLFPLSVYIMSGIFKCPILGYISLVILQMPTDFLSVSNTTISPPISLCTPPPPLVSQSGSEEVAERRPGRGVGHQEVPHLIRQLCLWRSQHGRGPQRHHELLQLHTHCLQGETEVTWDEDLTP